MAVVVAGSINVDLIQSVDALPRPGETVLALQSERLPGGKGANQAVAAARAGAQTRMIGAVGEDESGVWMTEQLSAAGVDTLAVVAVEGAATGTAYITVDTSGENQIIVASGANAALAPAMVDTVADADIRVAQLEVPVETVAAFFAASPGKQAVRVLNAAPAVLEAKRLFASTDVLIVNQHELAVYLGQHEERATPQAALAARALISRDDQLVIVTLGASGSIAVRAGSAVHVPAFPVVPRDAVGAGDCFVGALCAMLDRAGDARPTDEALLIFANAAAALCTQKPGAVPAMPLRSDVEAFIAAHPNEGRPI
ncbi:MULTISPECIES: ribokinase [unclassified Sphingobium]|uniref:ribokinase n=1 Tax=unclassified Sphingobium TaxID=2611147 RepID=UPI00222411D2|nr:MULTISPECIES: ribokinase [unclassified Sphingobium]MCW2350940.1 ribokinase [Sphingobium sp. B12D2B]MCW2370104.1 ribokinase [Sphingobium sp. B11D3D]